MHQSVTWTLWKQNEENCLNFCPNNNEEHSTLHQLWLKWEEDWAHLTRFSVETYATGNAHLLPTRRRWEQVRDCLWVLGAFKIPSMSNYLNMFFYNFERYLYISMYLIHRKKRMIYMETTYEEAKQKMNAYGNLTQMPQGWVIT